MWRFGWHLICEATLKESKMFLPTVNLSHKLRSFFVAVFILLPIQTVSSAANPVQERASKECSDAMNTKPVDQIIKICSNVLSITKTVQENRSLSSEELTNAILALHNIGLAYMNIKDFSNAVESYRIAFEAAAKFDPVGKTLALRTENRLGFIIVIHYGIALKAQNNLDAALQMFAAAESIPLDNETLKGVFFKVGVYSMTRDIWREKKEFRRAEDYAQKTIYAYEKTGKSDSELGENYAILAEIQSKLNKTEEAGRSYSAAFDIFQQGKNSRRALDAAFEASNIFVGLADMRALPFLEYQIANLKEQKPRLTSALLLTSAIFAVLGRAEISNEIHKNDLEPMAKGLEGSEPSISSMIYIQRGYLLSAMGMFEPAIQMHLKAVRLIREYPSKFKDPSESLLDAYSGLGMFYAHLKNVPKAIEYYEKALAINQDNLQIRLSYARFLARFNKKDSALQQIQKGKEFLKTLQRSGGHLYFLQLAETYEFLQKADEAEEYRTLAAKSILSAEKLEDSDAVVRLRIFALSTILSGSENLRDQAIRADLRSEFLRLMKIYFDRDLLRYDSQALDTISSLDVLLLEYISKGESDRAHDLTRFRFGMTLNHDLGITDQMKLAKFSPAEIQIVRTIQQKSYIAKKKYESLPKDVPPESRSKAWKENLLLELAKAIWHNRIEQQYRNSSKPMNSAYPTRKDVSMNVKDKELFLTFIVTKTKVITLQSGHASIETPIAEQAIDRGALQIDIQNLHLLSQNSELSPTYAIIKSHLGEVLWDRASPDQKFEVVGTKVFKNRKAKLEQNQGFDLNDMAPKERLEIGELAGEIDAKGAEALRKKLRRKLYDLLVGPILRVHSHIKNLIIVPDGPLYYLPFALLQDEQGVYLKDKVAISLAHSPGVWYSLRKRPASRATYPLLAVGNAVYSDGHTEYQSRDRSIGKQVFTQLKTRRDVPSSILFSQQHLKNLDHSADEVAEIGRMAYAKKSERTEHILTGIRANVEEIDRRRKNGTLKNYRIIHFAAHGLLVDGNPELNGIILTLPNAAKSSKPEEYAKYVRQNGPIKNSLLQLGDARTLDLDADLVVLSACETSLGEEMTGEGMVALPQGLLIGGARNVIASLWPVDDAATSQLMKKFYKFLLVDKQTPKEALRNAQSELSKSTNYANPYYWAGFVIYGE